MNNKSMKLKKYLEIYEISQGEAAKALKVSRTYLNAIINEKVEPGRILIRAIIIWTDSEVRTDDFPGWEKFR
ncbi:MAG: helix-turn-helix transcriptional regulator [Deltaproteobacteria bacterium]|nr:helix-turn-helix transcriptional regulator [Deltaproteobacteria bacterium]